MPYYGLTFSTGFIALSYGSSTGGAPYYFATHSYPNVAFQTASGPATASRGGGKTFSLVQLYLGYDENGSGGKPYNPPVTVSVTGTFQGNPVASCAYDRIFDDLVGTIDNLALVTTPGCIGVDQIAITDHVGEVFYVDDMLVILNP